MPFPKTLDLLRAAGYKFDGHRDCKGPTCNASLEIWTTPRGKKMPLEVDVHGNVEPHFAHCPDVALFRVK